MAVESDPQRRNAASGRAAERARPAGEPGARPGQDRGRAQSGDRAALHLRPGRGAATATGWRSCISSAAAMRLSKCHAWTSRSSIAGKTYQVAPDHRHRQVQDLCGECRARWRRAGAEIVTVAVRRVNLTDPGQPRLVDFIDPKKVTYLPNTAGCFTGEDAVRTLRLAREAGGWTLVKLEVLGEKKTALSRHDRDAARHRDADQGRLPGDGLLQRRSA